MLWCTECCVELAVSDQTDAAVLVAFDEEMSRITNSEASEAAYIVA